MIHLIEYNSGMPVGQEEPLEKLLLEKMLTRVEKPARYTGGELNMTEKTDAPFKFALCFPDVYEIGM